MNEPKFRVFYKELDRYLVPEYIEIGSSLIGPSMILAYTAPGYRGENTLSWCIDHPRYFNVEQFTHLTDQDDREIYAGDIYEMFGQVHPITVDYTHGLRFMWGDEQISKALTEYGIFRGTVHENPEVLK